MVSIKYKVNDNEFHINPYCADELSALREIAIYRNSFDITTPSYGIVSDTDFFCLNINNIPEEYTGYVSIGAFTITIKKMTSKELIDTSDAESKDVFDWLKQKIANTTDVPEGFALPVVTEDSIILYSSAIILPV